MRAAAMVMGLALAVEVGAAPVMAGQARAADLVTAARAQLGAGNVDSGLVLVGLALDSGTVATGRDRGNALVWRGVRRCFKGLGRHGAGRAGLHRSGFVAQPGAAADPGRPRPPGALLAWAGPGPRGAGRDAMAPHAAQPVKATPHPAVIVL